MPRPYHPEYHVREQHGVFSPAHLQWSEYTSPGAAVYSANDLLHIPSNSGDLGCPYSHPRRRFVTGIWAALRRIGDRLYLRRAWVLAIPLV